MSIHTSFSYSAQRPIFSLFGGALLAVALLGNHAQAATNVTKQYPGFTLYTDTDEMARYGCTESDLDRMMSEKKSNANSSVQGLADIYKNAMVTNNGSGNCRSNIQPVIEKIQEGANAGPFAMFQGSLLGKLFGSYIKQEIEDEAIKQMDAACDDNYNQGNSYLNSLQSGGLFSGGSTRSIAAVAAHSSGTNKGSGSYSGSGSSGTMATAGTYSDTDYDAAVDNLATQLASRAVNGSELKSGYYSLCGNTYYVGDYDYDNNGTLATSNISRITGTCSWTTVRNNITSYNHEYWCLTQDGDRKVSTITNNSPSNPANPSVKALQGDGTEASCSLGARAGYGTSNSAFRAKGAAKAANPTTTQNRAAPPTNNNSSRSFLGLRY